LIVDDEEAVRQSYRLILESDDGTQEIDDIASSLFDETPSFTVLDEVEFFFDETDLIVEEELQTGSYKIIETSQGMDAVEIIKKSLNKNQPFSLIFMDIRMPPGIDGVQAAKKIRQLDPNVEIVIMTAYSDYSFEDIVKTVGNPERLLYFNKPFKSEHIKQLASSLTQQWHLERKRLQQDQTDAE